jgi:hypothetical protein
VNDSRRIPDEVPSLAQCRIRDDGEGRIETEPGDPIIEFVATWDSIGIDMKVAIRLTKTTSHAFGMRSWYSCFVTLDFASILMILGLGAAVLGSLWLAITEGPAAVIEPFLAMIGGGHSS